MPVDEFRGAGVAFVTGPAAGRTKKPLMLQGRTKVLAEQLQTHSRTNLAIPARNVSVGLTSVIRQTSEVH